MPQAAAQCSKPRQDMCPLYVVFFPPYYFLVITSIRELYDDFALFHSQRDKLIFIFSHCFYEEE